MEQVLVVERKHFETLFNTREQDFLTDRKDEFLRTACERHTFMLRNTVEYDHTYKQVIPYAFLTCGDLIYVLKRLPKQNEPRLHNKLSIGVGGHINPLEKSSNKGRNIVECGLFRELNEEVNLSSNTIVRVDFVGAINDDTSEVGRVHIGFVYHIALENEEIAVLETDKMRGKWVHKDNLLDYYDDMETWSQVIINKYLLNR